MENKRNHEIGKCSKCGATQFLSYGICNYNGICNGLIEPVEKSTRELALEWWNNIKSKNKKQLLCQNYRFSVGLQGTSWQSLTGREIEEIYLKENTIVKHIGNGNLVNESGNIIHKMNQKQFKEFNPELFKAYIDKFSDEDKLAAIRVIHKTLPNSNFKKHLSEWFE
jgi:hypothetical protein